MEKEGRALAPGVAGAAGAASIGSGSSRGAGTGRAASISSGSSRGTSTSHGGSGSGHGGHRGPGSGGPGSSRGLLPQRANRRGKLNALLLGAIAPVGLLIVWQALAELEMISPLLFPAPLAIARSFGDLIASGIYFENLWISVLRATGGFALGGGLGLLFGLLVGFFKRTERALDPTVQMIRMVPSLAVAPLFVLWFGLGESSKVLLIAKGAFFPLYINTFLGIRGVDNKLFDVTKVLGFSKFKQVTRLIIPGAMPNILLGARLSLGVAWLGLVVAELLGSTSGIGYIMSDARQFTQTSVVFVGIITFAVIGQFADSLLRFAERRLLRWRDNFKG